jgi:hypothetical protein
VAASGQGSSAGQPALIHQEEPTLVTVGATQGDAFDWLD